MLLKRPRNLVVLSLLILGALLSLKVQQVRHVSLSSSLPSNTTSFSMLQSYTNKLINLVNTHQGNDGAANNFTPSPETGQWLLIQLPPGQYQVQFNENQIVFYAK